MSVAHPSLRVRVLRVLKSLFIAEPHIVLPAGRDATASKPVEVKIECAGAVPAPASSISAPERTIERANTFALAARLAAVSKLNVASARKPARRNFLATPGRAIPIAAGTSTYVRSPTRLASAKPMTRIIKPGRRDSAVIISIVAARPTQPVLAKRAA